MTDFLKNVFALLQQKGVSKNKMLTDLKLGKNSFVNWENRGTIPGGEPAGSGYLRSVHDRKGCLHRQCFAGKA